jgi:hypothetical protein
MPELPGLAALTWDYGSYLPSSISGLGCGSPGNCAAVGDYMSPGTSLTAPFVAAELNGTWGVQPLAGLPAEAPSTHASFTNISCGSAGSCTAVGTYTGTDNVQRVFEAAETGGTWGTAAVLDMTGLGSVQSASVSGLSCPAAGECTLVGSYYLAGGAGGAFTADESAGAWGTLQPLSLASLQSAAAPSVTGGMTALSCGAPGDCTASGLYEGTQYEAVPQPFIVTETGHAWGAPQLVPGLSSLSQGGPSAGSGNQDEISSISCPDAGDCAAVGTFYLPSSPYPQSASTGSLFTIDEAGGTWGQAQALSTTTSGTVQTGDGSVSCRSAGDCVIAANGPDASGQSEPVTASEAGSGAWGATAGIPGIAAGEGGVTGVTCVPSGDCTAFGAYDTTSGSYSGEVFSATEPDGGAMGTAQQVGAQGYASGTASYMACPQDGQCTALYDWADYGGPNSPRIATEGAPDVPLSASTVKLTPSAPVLYGVAGESESLTVTVSSPAGGTPLGEVGVTAPGAGTICSITLVGGTGTCQVAGEPFSMGATTLTASYLGDPDHQPATGTATVTMAQAATVTHLAFTPGSVTFSGAGTTLTVSGTVSSAEGTPSGIATVLVDGKALPGCTNTGFTGTYSCKGTTGILAAGRHLVTLSYPANGPNGTWMPSTSAALPLTVAKRASATSLALAKTSVTYGHESYEKFTVSVGRAGSVYPTGKVAVQIGGTTICTITLGKGTGGCVLANTRLRAGTYTLSALYSGDGNYAPSRSAKKNLKVAK